MAHEKTAFNYILIRLYSINLDPSLIAAYNADSYAKNQQSPR